MGLPEGFKDAVDWLFQPTRYFLWSTLLLAAVLWLRRWFTRTWVLATILVGGAVFFVLALEDPDFHAIVTKPDNVPIVGLLALVVFFLWLALRLGVANDERTKRGEPTVEAELGRQRVFCWPDLVYIELICLLLVTVLLIAWSIAIPAPLEEPAGMLTPNPSKAPWYFLGLQELLVYFDPWIAGVLVPGLIIVGLGAIPYLDRNPRGNGYYTFRERPFAISFFVTGFVVFWISFVVLGTFLRGPNWSFFGLFETWTLHKHEPLASVDLSTYFWVDLLHRARPAWPLVREAPGILALFVFFVVLPQVLGRTLLRKLYAEMGAARFHIFLQFLLWFGLVPLKMLLRWTVNLKYLVSLPEWFFNV